MNDIQVYHSKRFFYSKETIVISIVLIVVKLLSESEVDYFLHDISKKLSDQFYAGVICDKDGFILSSKIPKNDPNKFLENELALMAISNRKNKVFNPNHIKLIMDLNKEKTIKLLLLLKKKNISKTEYKNKKLDEILSLQTLF
ncbi:MAG: hypothetical protein JW891_17330 [Candidatus Lokiarchaeota archaeon]|nr:hypothetical protein [Candidatus Lokiarchaeota archaeon]